MPYLSGYSIVPAHKRGRRVDSRGGYHSNTFTQASLINESSAALTNFPHPCGLVQWANLWGRPQHWHKRGHASPQIVNSEQRSVDDVICHQWLTNQITEAPLHWRHEPTSIHQVSVADTPCEKHPVYSCRLPRGSMLEQNTPYQCFAQV